MAVSLNNNSQTLQSSEEQAKGFLYKIKTDTNQTIGYLCGTIHNDLPSNYPPLHEKIYKSLAKSQTLFHEMDILDKETAREYLQKNEGHSEINEQKIQEVTKQKIAEITINPTTVEDHLTLKALSLGLEIKSLETDASRNAANQAIGFTKEVAVLVEKKTVLASSFLLVATQKIKDAVKNIEIYDFSTAVDHLFQGYEALALALKHIEGDFVGESSETVSLLIDKYEHLFASFDLDPVFMKTLKILRAFEQNKMIHLFDQTKLAWKLGDEKMLVQCQLLLCSTLVDSKKNELSMKWGYLRDTFMLDRIHKDLLASSKDKKRSFYAVGSAHLLLNYENLKMRLEKKGWKIVNAYSKNESKAMHSMVQ